MSGSSFVPTTRNLHSRPALNTAVSRCVGQTDFATFSSQRSESKQLWGVHRLVIAGILASSTIHAAEPQSLDRMLEPYLKEFGLPALAAAVFREGVVISSGAVGTRRAAREIPVTIEDRFHLGSDSKAFTSLLAGQFVGAGKLRRQSIFRRSVYFYACRGGITLLRSRHWDMVLGPESHSGQGLYR
jgi:CubicO group peptidase (beta-lactamase class C family)